MNRYVNFVVLAFVLNSCSYVTVNHPSGPHEHQALDQAALGFATNQAMERLPLNIATLSGEPVFVEVIGSDTGRLWVRAMEVLATRRLRIVEKRSDAKFVLRIAERSSGVDGITQVYWYTVLYWTWYSSALSSQGNCDLYFQMLDEAGAVVDSGSSHVARAQVDLERNKTLWILFIPIPLRRYVADGEEYIPTEPLAKGLPVIARRPLY